MADLYTQIFKDNSLFVDNLNQSVQKELEIIFNSSKLQYKDLLDFGEGWDGTYVNIIFHNNKIFVRAIGKTSIKMILIQAILLSQFFAENEVVKKEVKIRSEIYNIVDFIIEFKTNPNYVFTKMPNNFYERDFEITPNNPYFLNTSIKPKHIAIQWGIEGKPFINYWKANPISVFAFYQMGVMIANDKYLHRKYVRANASKRSKDEIKQALIQRANEWLIVENEAMEL